MFNTLSQALNKRKGQLSILIIATPQFEIEPEEEKDSLAVKPVPSSEAGAQEPKERSKKKTGKSPKGIQKEGRDSKDSAGSKKGKAKPQLAAKRCGVRPPIAKGSPLATYGDDQLDELLEWICSDEVERSEDEQVKELRETLNLAKREV